MKRTICSFIACLFFGTFVVSQSARAQRAEPTPESPFGHLGNSGVVPASKGMYNAVAKVEESLQELTKKLSKDGTPDSKDMAKMYLLVGQLNRWLAFLDHYREPAVVDWRFRAAFYHRALLDVRSRYYATPQASKDREKVIKLLANGQAARGKAFMKTLKMLQDGEIKQAENSIEKIQSEILSISGVLHDTDKEPFYTPMNKVVGEVAGPMSNFRNREARDAEQAERSKLDELIKQLEESLTSGSGAEGLQNISKQWQLMHLQRLRVYAFVSTSASHSGESSVATGPAAPANLPDDLTARIKSSIIDYVKREAGNVNRDGLTRDSALQSFQAIQSVLAELTLRADDAAWEDALQKSLNELAKSYQLNSDVYNYQLATKDLLRWRQRTAEEWATAQSEPLVTSIATAELTTKDNFVGMYEQNRQATLPVIMKALPDLIPTVVEKLVGKSVKSSKVLPIDGSEKPQWYTQADDGFYCVFSNNRVSKVVLPILRKDLLVESKQAPLSLAAAAALLSAEVGASEHAGGKLTSFTLEGYVTRMTNIPESQSSLLPLGSLGPDPRGDAKRYMMLQCQLEPTWIQHKYYFVSQAK